MRRAAGSCDTMLSQEKKDNRDESAAARDGRLLARTTDQRKQAGKTSGVWGCRPFSAGGQRRLCVVTFKQPWRRWLQRSFHRRGEGGLLAQPAPA